MKIGVCVKNCEADATCDADAESAYKTLSSMCLCLYYT